MKEALLIIDVQNDYFPGGARELYKPAEALERIKELIAASRESGRLVVYMQHFNGPEDSFFKEGTPGAEIHAEIAPEDGDRVFVKRLPNSFLNTGLDEYLRGEGVEKLTVCGMMTHMCVDTSVRAASDLGYEVELVKAACAAPDLSWNGHSIPAPVVNEVYMASLNGVFCTVV